MLPEAKNVVKWLTDLLPGILFLFVVMGLFALMPFLAGFQWLVVLALVALSVLFFELDLLPGLLVVLFVELFKIPLVFLVAFLFLAWVQSKIKLG